MAKNSRKSELQDFTAAIASDAKRPQAVQVFSDLLDFERAPKGSIESDFKTAVYVCAATKHFTFEEWLSTNQLVYLSFMMTSVGFTGNISNVTVQDYMDTLQELVDEGALIYVGEGAGFMSAGFSRVSEGTVSCTTNYTPQQNGQSSELRFTDETGVYPLFSKFVIIPGDKVRVVINTFLKTAYVQQIVTMRKMIMGEASDNKIYFREKGFATFNTVPTKDGVPYKIGDLVVCEIISRKSPDKLIFRTREVVHETGSLNTFICKAVLDHNIPSTWPDAVKHSIKNIPEVVKPEEIKGRVDLRDLPLVTIDSEDARDFDDAVYCKKEGDKFRLYVAIADVSYYVRTGSAIDAEALERTTSVYFPFYVIPMLPKELSNGICSLNPNVDRLCMVCEMVVDKSGKIGDYEFYPAVMNSHARLTYTEAHLMITEDRAIEEEHQKCIPWIKDLHELYQALKRARDARGVFEFESTEVHFLFDEKWKIKGMEPDVRNEAHMLIEECMIAANICAATFVGKKKFQTLYRIHERPSPEKLDKLRAILSRYGIDLRHQYEPTPLDFRDVSDQVKRLGEGIHQVISLQLLRSMSKAKYSPDNVGHFGLALDNYSHFTSPIRRYPDLQIHRVIKYILEKQEKRSWGKIGSQQYSHEALENLGVRCSEKEIASSDAEYDVDNSLKCEYLKNFIGEAVDGTVSTVMSNGAFITLNDFYIDGMISVRTLLSADAGKQSFMVDRNTEYKVGDQIKVRVAEVNSLARFITLLPVQALRKSDAKFDIEERKTKLKANSTDKPEVNNESKDMFFNRIADISRGVKATEHDNVVRENLNYSIANELDLSNSVAAIMAEDNDLLDSAAQAAEATAKAEIEERQLAAQASKSKAKSKKAEAKIETKTEAQVEAKSAKSAAKTEAKSEAKAAKSDSKSAKTSAAKSSKTKATQAEESTAPVITVKRKGKSTEATEVITLDGKAAANVKRKAKSDDIDPLLVDTASRIDADLADEKKSTKLKKKSEAKATKTEATTDTKVAAKASGSKSRSNAKRKQEVPEVEAVTEHEIEGATKVTVKVKTRGAKKTATEELQSMVESVKPEKNTTVTKTEAKKASTKAVAAKATTTKATATKAATKATATKTTAKATKATAKATTKAAEPKVEKATAKATAAKTAAKSSKTAVAKAEEKPAAKKATAKKATATKTAVAKAEEKPAAKKATAKKATATKTAVAKAEEKPAAKKATAKKATATKAAAKPAAKKATATKATATKATAKKATATKATATKATAKKATATKATAKKATATKATATKATATKATAKKATATKATATKATAKKATATKATATKATAKKATATKATATKAAAKPAAKKTTATKATATKAAAKPAAKKATATKATATKAAAKPAAKKATATKATATKAAAKPAAKKATATKATATKAAAKPAAKKATATKATATKAAAKPAAKKATATKASASKAAAKPAAKKATATKATATKAAAKPAAKKATATKATATKAAAKPAAKKTTAAKATAAKAATKKAPAKSKK